MNRTTTSRVVASLPIANLAPGEICPPLDPEHDSWAVIAPWDDPLACRRLVLLTLRWRLGRSLALPEPRSMHWRGQGREGERPLEP